MGPVDLSVALAGWQLGSGPLYRRLATSLREAIRRGELGAGARLPSERALSQALDTSRTTVVAAYGLLRDEGLVDSRRGSGTRVTPGGSWTPTVPAAAMPGLKLLDDAADGIIDCSSSVISDLEGISDELLRVTPAQVRRLAAEFDYRALGIPTVRAAIAERYSQQGLPTSPGEVLVTTGAQQSIELLFTAFGGERGSIAIENPTYVGALDAARKAGATIVGVETDAEGAEIRDLRDTLARSSVRLLYLMPGGHNPTGAVMGDLRRRQVVQVAAEAGTPVVDDMTLSELMGDGAPVPLMPAGHEATVITVGSLSKLFWAGLRFGWIRAPESVIERVARLKVVTDLGSSHLSQLLALRFLPVIGEVRALRRQQLAERMDLLAGLLAERLSGWSWTRPPGGPFLWVRIPRGGAEAFSRMALQHGVRVLPGSRLSPDGAFADHLRISCVARPAELEQAVERLVRASTAFESAIAERPLAAEAVV